MSVEASGTRAAVFVVCGEPSGDWMAAEVLEHLAPPAFGVAGPELRRRGLQSVLSMESLSEMGIGAARKAVPLVLAWRRLKDAVRRRQPRAALLVGFSEFNARLGRWLRAQGIHVVWYAPPQVWAWRRRRGPRLVGSADSFAVVLPFEEGLWREMGADAHYVGHPAVTWTLPEIRRLTGRIALLPGSRPSEVERLWPLMLQTADLLRRLRPDWSFEAGLSPGLPAALRVRVARSAVRANIGVSQDARAVLARAELSLCCSGTATLQSALSGCPPLVVYPLAPLAEAVLRRLVSVPHVGLPNLVLDRRAFPELVGQAVQPIHIASAARDLEAQLPRHRASCVELAQRLGARLNETPSRSVARLVERRL
ncbi:MAG: hypothetical protein R3B89_16895 [Polyangiaceae bacterium]